VLKILLCNAEAADCGSVTNKHSHGSVFLSINLSALSISCSPSNRGGLLDGFTLQNNVAARQVTERERERVMDDMIPVCCVKYYEICNHIRAAEVHVFPLTRYFQLSRKMSAVVIWREKKGSGGPGGKVT